MPSIVLLGPQRFTPTLGEAVTRAGIAGRLASVTAGWQEREAEDLELHEHLGERTENLMLYARSEDVLERDAEFRAAYRERQEQLRELQQLYRGRLAHTQAALRELELLDGDPALLGPERVAALEAMRTLDAHHLARIRAIHDDFDAAMNPASRGAIERHARQIDRQLARVEAVAIAGGHVAILLNRLRLFDLGRRLLKGGRSVIAWSAGAMAISERVVLFHHFPPQGYGNTEVVEAGLGLARGVVPLPHAKRRLALDDPDRISRLSRRFAPAVCVAMADGCWMQCDAVPPEGEAPAWRYGPGTRELLPDGRLRPLEAA